MVKQIMQKIVAILIVLALTMGNLLLVATESYAAFEELEEQVKVSSDKNISFDTYFDVGENVHSVILDSSDEAVVNFEINVGEGYLKSGKIELNNANFEIVGIESQNIPEIVNEFNANSITLNQISSKTRAIIDAKVKINHKEIVDEDYLGRETTAIFTSNYVNIKGQTKEINSNIKIRVDWTADATSTIDSSVEKYMILNNKTIIQTKVTSGIEGNVLPIKNTKINITAPQINGVNPEEVRVTAINTIATNGATNGNSFGTENYNYNKENGSLEINVENSINENKISWRNGTDEFIVTYIYEGEQGISNIDLKAQNNITTYKETQITNSVEKQQEIALSGNNVDFGISATQNLSKGYMYAASNYETEYKTTWSANITYSDWTDSIIFQQNTDYFVQNDGKVQYVNLNYRKTTINKANFDKILGEEGTAEIYSGENLIGTINKDTVVDGNGNYEFKYTEEIANIMIKTSKPVTEGKLVIENTKVITAKGPYIFEQMKTFVAIENNLVGSSNGQEAQDIKVNTNLTETSTKAELQIGKETLSTVGKNEDVEIRTVLEADDITDDLYKNPTIEITLPEEVENIEIKSTNILFNDQIQIADAHIENGRIIKVSLAGEQTNFITDGNKGITLIFNTNLSINKQAVSKETEATLKVTNEKAVLLENEGISSAKVNILAPTGVITLNSVTNTKTGESATSLESNKEEVALERKTEKQIATYTNTIINNNQTTISNIKILGNIPHKGDIMGSTLNAKLVSAISSLEGKNCEIYYTENENAAADIKDINNGWTTEVIENAKQYLIIVNENVENGSQLNFTYNIEIPENLEYGEKAISTYKVEYTEGENAQGQIAAINSAPFIKYAIAEENQNFTTQTQTAPQVIVTTGTGPVLEATLEDNTVDGTAYIDQYVIYTLTLKNTGNADAENINGKITIPEGTQFAVKDEETNIGTEYKILEGENEQNLNIGTIEKNSTKQVTFALYIKESNKTSNVSLSLEGSNIETIQTNTLNIKTKDKLLEEFKLYENQGSINIGESFSYTLSVDKSADKELNNAKVKIDIPDGIKFNYAVAYDYNDEEAEPLVQTDRLKNGSIEMDLNFECDTYSIRINLTPERIINENIYATFSCDEGTQLSDIKTIKVNTINADIKVNSNIDSGAYIKLGEKIEYEITIKNTSITSLDNFVVQLNLTGDFEEPSIQIDGKLLSEDEYSYSLSSHILSINSNIEINQSKTIKISAPLDTDFNNKEDKNITTKISIDEFNYEREFNYIIEKHIEKDEEDDEESEEPENPVNPTQPTDSTDSTKTYKILGTAWLDSNKNGSMESDETKLSGIPVKAINSKGEEKATSTTSENGTYTLENLPAGDYTVVFEYDSGKYLLTTYQAEGIEESVNSNVIKTKINEKDVATTNTIKISDRSIANINIGLIQGSNFDLSLNKKVTQISMANSKRTLTLAYDTQLAKMDLDYQYINNTNLAVEYEITVTNEGDIPGTATKIIDYLPKEFDFSSELNSNWYKSGNNIETKELANEVIAPGESKTIKLVLTKSMTENDNGIVVNTAEIAETYNEFGEPDSDSLPANNIDGEDDISSANVILGLRTGGPVTYVALTLAIMVLITLGAYEINKRVLKV